MEKTGPVSYKVNVGVQGVWKRHVDQMLTHPESEPKSQHITVNPPVSSVLLPQSGSCPKLYTETTHPEKNDVCVEVTESPKISQTSEPTQAKHSGVTPKVRRYPVRITKPPARYGDE